MFCESKLKEHIPFYIFPESHPLSCPPSQALPSRKVAAASTSLLPRRLCLFRRTLYLALWLIFSLRLQHQRLDQLVPDHGGGGPANFQLVLVQLAEEGVADSR